MKIGRFEKSGCTFFGLVNGDDVTELKGSPFDCYKPTNIHHQYATLKVLVPADPQNFYCAGLNYEAHYHWAKAKGYVNKPQEQADVGYRSPNALIATGEPIVIPIDSVGPVNYEGELVAVIGKKGRNVRESEAMDYVLGLTLGNDASERNWQRHDRTFWRAKNCDSFKPMGPVIVTGLDPMNLTITIKVNERVVSEYWTGKMLFSLEHHIAAITRYSTIYPGDVLWLGTEGATEPDINQGDIVEVSVPEIGILRNPVVRASR